MSTHLKCLVQTSRCVICVSLLPISGFVFYEKILGSKKNLNIFRFSYIFQKYENVSYEPCTILCSYLHTRYIHVICNMIYDTAVAFPVYGRSNCYVSNISPADAA